METKKNFSADVNKKSTYYFSIGLFVSTAIMVMAFEWRQKDAFIVLDSSVDNPGDELLNIPITKDLPPIPKQIKINPIIVEVVDDEPEDSSFTFDPPSIDSVYANPIKVEAPTEDVGDEPVIIAEVAALPNGGFDAFYKHVAANFKYPAQARRMGIEGKVYVEFIVNKDGSLVEVKTVKGIGGGCDEEAVRVVRNSPNWIPARQRGKPVRQRYTLPITFRLQ